MILELARVKREWLEVIVERTPTAENGDIVVALIDDSATVKRFYKEDGYYRLQPENDAMEPIIVTNMNVLGSQQKRKILW